MDKIKPVAWAFKQDWARFQGDRHECRLLPNFYWGSDLGDDSYSYEPLYDQSAIDTLRAEVERLQSDAKRYRWFRAGLESNHADAYEIAEFAYRGGLDAAIDAAMQGDA